MANKVESKVISKANGTPTLFVSYSHQDGTQVGKITSALEAKGVKLWADQQITAGENWENTLEVALRKSKHFLFFVSPASVQSPSANFELGVALYRDDVQIIPIMIKSVEESEIPSPLLSRHILHAENSDPDEIADQVVALLDQA